MAVVVHNNNKTFLIMLPLYGIVRFHGLCLGIALFAWIAKKYERTCVYIWAGIREKISEIGSLNIVTRTDCTSVTVLTDGFSIGLSLIFFSYSFCHAFNCHSTGSALINSGEITWHEIIIVLVLLYWAHSISLAMVAGWLCCCCKQQSNDNTNIYRVRRK